MQAAILYAPNDMRLATVADSVVKPGDLVLRVKLARLRGAARVIVSEPSEARRAAALQAGADVVIDPTAADLRAVVHGETRGQGPDVVICAIGIPALAAQAIGLAAKDGRVSLFAGLPRGIPARLTPTRFITRSCR